MGESKLIFDKKDDKFYKTLFETLIDNIPEYVFFKDKRSKFIKVNPKAAEALGIKDPDEAIGKSDYDFFPEIAEKTRKDEIKIMKTGIPRINEPIEMEFPDGSVHWVQVAKHPLYDDKDNIIGIAGISKDITDWMDLNEKLTNKNAELEFTFKVTPDALIFADTNRNITKINPAFEKLFGYKEKELIGKKTKILYANKNDYYKQGKKRYNKNAQAKYEPYEIRYKKKNGEIFISETIGTPIVNEKDKVVGLVASVRDITKRKKVEEKIKKSEKRFRNLINSSQDSIYVLDNDLRQILVNKAAERFLQMPREKLIDRKLTDIFPGFEKTEFYKTFKKVLKTKKPDKVVDKFVFNDGRVGYYQVNVTPTSEGILCVSRDITEQKKSEEELKKGKELFSTIVETAPSLLLITDKKGNVSYISKNVKKFTGYYPKDFIGTVNWWVHKDDNERARTLFNKTYSEGISGKNFEYKAVKKNGNVWYASSSWETIYDINGNFDGIVMQTIDVTEKIKREQELKKGLMKYNLKEGYLYLEFEKIPTKSITAFKDMIKIGYSGIVFSRTPKKQFQDDIKNIVNYYWIAHRSEKNSIKVKNIIKNIEKLSENKAIFFDRFDYIITKLGFKKALALIQNIKEIAYIKNHTIIISLDDETISLQEKTKIQKETKEIEPKLKIPIDEHLKEIIEYVYKKNIYGIKPSYSDIGEKLDMSKPTTRNKIRILVQKGYITEKKKGRRKILEITDKTRHILN